MGPGSSLRCGRDDGTALAEPFSDRRRLRLLHPRVRQREEVLRRLTVTHLTTYRYAETVEFGPHRMMLRPRDSHELRLISSTLTTSLPADLVWTYDIFGNVVCTAHFQGMASELS